MILAKFEGRGNLVGLPRRHGMDRGFNWFLLSIVLLVAAPLAARQTPGRQSPRPDGPVYETQPEDDSSMGGGGGCDIRRCPSICTYKYPPLASLTYCTAGPKQCDSIDEYSGLVHCTCTNNHPMPNSN